MEGIPALSFWELVIDVFEPSTAPSKPLALTLGEQLQWRRKLHNAFEALDYVPPSLPPSTGKAKLYALEDNDAVIKMTVKGRSPNWRHVGRTHRVDLDWLFDRVRLDPGIFIKFVGTKEQLADILTKGSFTAEAWTALIHLLLLFPETALTRKPSS